MRSAFVLCALVLAVVGAGPGGVRPPRSDGTHLRSDSDIRGDGGVVRLGDLLLPSQMTISKQQLRATVSELCGRFGIGVLFEDTRDEFLADTLMDRLEVSISLSQGTSLGKAMDQLAGACPDVVWRQHEGIIIVSARRLACIKDNPLAYVFPHFDFTGSVGDFLAKLYWAVPFNSGRRLSIVHGAQDLEVAPQVSLCADAPVSVETLLARALSRYGVKCWPVVTLGEVPLPFGRLEFAVGWPPPRALSRAEEPREQEVPTKDERASCGSALGIYVWPLVSAAGLLGALVAVLLLSRRRKRSHP